MLGDNLCNFISLYRSPSQLQDQFECFKKILEINLESAVQNNPFLVAVLTDCTGKLSNWCKYDLVTTGKITPYFEIWNSLKFKKNVSAFCKRVFLD